MARSRWVRILLAASLGVALFTSTEVAAPDEVQAAFDCDVDYISIPSSLKDPNRWRVSATGNCSQSVYYLRIEIGLWRGSTRLQSGAYSCSNCYGVSGPITYYCTAGASGTLHGRAQVSYRFSSSADLQTTYWNLGPSAFRTCG